MGGSLIDVTTSDDVLSALEAVVEDFIFWEAALSWLAKSFAGAVLFTGSDGALGGGPGGAGPGGGGPGGGGAEGGGPGGDGALPTLKMEK